MTRDVSEKPASQTHQLLEHYSSQHSHSKW